MFKKFKPISSETDSEKIEQIFETYGSTMLYTARKILNDNALAEDAVSESIEKIIHNIDKIKEISCYQTRAYIVIIVRSVSLNMLKRLKKHKINDISLDILKNVPDPSLSILDEMTGYESYEALVLDMSENKNDTNDKFFEAMLHPAANEAIKREMEELPSSEELDKLYPISDTLNQRVTKIIDTHKKAHKKKQMIKKSQKLQLVSLYFRLSLGLYL